MHIRRDIRLLFLTVLLLMMGVPAVAASPLDSLYRALDVTLARRDYYAGRKVAKIDSLRRLFSAATTDRDRLRLAEDLYRETYTYHFDSAMHYVELGEGIALRLKDEEGIARSRIHRSVLLSTGGYFSEAVDNLSSIALPGNAGRRDPQTASDSTLLGAYYFAWEWAYSMWAEYADDKVYAPEYYRQEKAYQDSLIGVLPAGSQPWHYWQGEHAYRLGHFDEAELHYQQTLKGLQPDERLYAMTTYGLALVAQRTADMPRYEEYLLRAALSDQLCPLKENLALQELALYIYKVYPNRLSKANRYLKVAMEDARFYHNRLRMLEVASKFHYIVGNYQEWGEREHRRALIALAVVSLLAVGLLVSLLLLRRQWRKVEMHRQALARANEAREGYVALFLDLCAAYIYKLNSFQSLVKRKVMAKQTDDLLKMVSTTRLSEADAKEFFVQFDTAFLRLYPDFIAAFNALLRPDGQIEPKRGELLTTELRIFALVRIGVKDSAKIATLLFYSPQTIYNYRSGVKNRAIDKDTFERDVMELCKV